ncbi:MAG: hypothetical protein ABEH88_05290 [Halobacteriales archaeon]
MVRDTTPTDGKTRLGGRTNRRRFLALTGSLLGVATTAGCLSELGFEEESARAPPLVDDRPDAVYHPTHNEAMKMVNMKTAGPYKIALSYAFPHRFWTVEGGDTSKVTVDRDDSMHLMTSVWHGETGVVPPTVEPSVKISRDDDVVESKPPWQMLSQPMGFHFGDNFQLPESDTYDVEVTLPPPTSTRTKSLSNDFGESVSASFELEFDPETVRSLEFTQFDDKAGTRAALDPMGMTSVEKSQLPPIEDLPGRSVGEPEMGDGVFAVRALDAPPAGFGETSDAGGSRSYLAVSARTPYNRYPLALMSLSATLEGPDGTRFDDQLTETLHPDLGYHYGAAVREIGSGDTLTLTVDSPPGAARHEGYETAFFDMGSVAVEI